MSATREPTVDPADAVGASAVVVILTGRVKSGTEDAVFDALATGIEATHAEPGCLGFALLRDHEDATKFALVERWATEAALKEHLETSYEAAMDAAVRPNLAEPPQILQMTVVGTGASPKGML